MQRQRRNFLKIERWRSTFTLLLAESPEKQPDYEGSVPAKLVLRGSWIGLLLWFVGFCLLGVIVGGLISSLSVFSGMLTSCIWEGVCLLIIASNYFWKVDKLQIEEGRIRMRGWGNVWLPWEDAQLFLRYRTSTLTGKYYYIYELISSNTCVSWRSLPEKSSLFAIWKPIVDYPIYNQQIEEITTFINAQTGLSLHDLGFPRIPDKLLKTPNGNIFGS